MTDDELQAWANNQVAVLIGCGIDPLDAQNTIKRVLARLPDGADPRAWMPPVDRGNVEIAEDDLVDARADWYADENVPDKFRMILDAPEYESKS